MRVFVSNLLVFFIDKLRQPAKDVQVMCHTIVKPLVCEEHFEWKV